MSEGMRVMGAVGLGSGLGGAVRWGTTATALALIGPSFPLGTLVVNIVGSLLLGLLAGLLTTRAGDRLSPTLRAGLGTGFCGGLTTFSFFSWQVVMFSEAGLSFEAVLYVALSLVLPLAAVVLGFRLGARTDLAA